MKRPISQSELSARIDLNCRRLADDAYYQIDDVFQPADADWPADKEGRALLAFVSHYKINGTKIPCMDELVARIPQKAGDDGVFGPAPATVLYEQQLSGHSWLLRGLCEYHEQFGDALSISLVRSIVETLFLPTRGRYASYPVHRDAVDEGAVSGNSVRIIDNWNLSSDVGCAFMSIDGLSHAYALTKDPAIKDLLDEMIAVYLGIDKVALRVQTHCTLTAARGMVRMYQVTGETRYLDDARTIYDLYVNGGGMTYTYQNLNWWGRPDTWTEPCAIVDSLMLATELYRITGEEHYRVLATRVYHNGLATSQRSNGGAGTDTLVADNTPWDYLQADMYEARFCCTMRLAEGLWYVHTHRDLLAAETVGAVTKQPNGVYADGDILYAEVSGGAEQYADGFVEMDGHKLCPIVPYYRVPEDIIKSSKQKILFK